MSATATPPTPATPANADTNMDDVAGKPPAGIVLPPRDIRAIVEKTAGYVARNGPVFEGRIRDKEKHNPKFAFLNSTDPYYAFYAWRLSEIRAGRGTDVSAGRTPAAATPAAPEPEKPTGPAPPPEFRFSARMPNISAQDLDIVRLTALYAAKHGRSFLTSLAQREARNFQFDFLRPNHSLYQYFSRLIDQYTELLRPNGGPSVEELERNVREKFHILDAARGRAEWTRHQEKERVQKEEEAEAERIAYAQIDWHDFVVVETVVFTEADEQTELPPPTSLSDLQHASLEQKAMMSLQSDTLRIEEAMPTADPYPVQNYSAYPPPASAAPAVPAPQQPIAPPPPAVPVAAPHQPAPTGPQNMRIRTNYTPAAMQRRNQQQTSICPNCHQPIPLNELEEHMRIELLDPRWKEQRARHDAKFATTNLNTNDTVANLKRLASQRSDLFDVGQEGGVDEEERERRKKVAISGSWDGGAESKEGVRGRNVDLEGQIREIHRKAGQVARPGVGPQRQ